MSDGHDENPYQSPEDPYQPPESPDNDYAGSSNPYGEDTIPPEASEALYQTRPWVLFLGILTIIGAVMMVFGSCFFMFSGAAMGGGGPFGGGMGIGIGVLYLLMSLVYMAAGIFLINYGRRIGDYRSSGNVADFTSAIQAQKSFWRLAGIITLVFMVLYFGFIAVMIVAGIAGAGGFGF